jgi:hypothetical protein
VLPGAQALVGFQFAAVLTESFDKLPPLIKTIHIAALACVALSTVFLMAPAAFHRIVEEGEDTERLHRFASAMILASMAFLAMGIAGDVLVVADKIFASLTAGVLLSAITLFAYLGWWFGYMVYRRASGPARAGRDAMGRFSEPSGVK